MSINHDHLHRIVTEMEQGVAATTKYTWLDLAQEVIRLREELQEMIADVSTIDGDPQYSQVEWLFAAFTAMKLRSIIGVHNLDLGDTND